MAEIRNDEWQDRGLETPSGKKYSMERAVRPSSAMRNVVHAGHVGEQVTQKFMASKSARTPENIKKKFREEQSEEDEEYRAWLEEKQRKSEEEKIKRFERMEQEMQGKS